MLISALQQHESAVIIAQTVKNLPAMQRPGCDPWVGNLLWRREWQSTSVFLPKESHGQRSLAGYSLWGRQELDTTEWLTHTHTHTRTHTDTHTSPSLLSLPLTPPSCPSAITMQLPLLCSSFSVAVCFTRGSVYMSVPLSRLFPNSPSPALCTSPLSMSASLFLPCK